MTGQLVKIQELVNGHAGSASVLPIFHLCHSLFHLTILVSPGFFPLQS